MTHASTADSSFAAPRNLVRLSVGIESAGDLIDDLEPGARPLAGRRRRVVLGAPLCFSPTRCYGRAIAREPRSRNDLLRTTTFFRELERGGSRVLPERRVAARRLRFRILRSPVRRSILSRRAEYADVRAHPTSSSRFPCTISRARTRRPADRPVRGRREARRSLRRNAAPSSGVEPEMRPTKGARR